MHTDIYNLADISCLVVNASSQEVGDSYHLKAEVETLVVAVYKTHWLHYFTRVNHALDMTRVGDVVW